MSRFSLKTLEFLRKAGRQKRPDWLEENENEYNQVLREPLTQLAETVSQELRKLAPDYHFPKRGLGRLKRPARFVAERGGGLYKNWMSYSAARPRTSRFEHNPNLFFLINPEDKDDPVLVAGGLYMPSSLQTRKIREAIARDATAFDRLFAIKDFARRFPGGFSKEKSAIRPPRGFDPGHARMDWLKLQAFFVWRPYTRKDFSSPDFAALVSQDFKQILRLNRLLESVLAGQPPRADSRAKPSRRGSVLDHLQDLDAARPAMDF